MNMINIKKNCDCEKKIDIKNLILIPSSYKIKIDASFLN